MTRESAIPDALVGALRDAQHVCVLTGAGVSAESGVPTFRDARQGLWAKYDPQKLATPDGFLSDPALTWEWYRWRRQLVSDVEPNPGHFALAELERLVPKLTLVTQNVDGLHQLAGSVSVIEFHGNIFVDRCFAEGTIVEEPIVEEPIVKGPNVEACDSEDVPTCPRCGSLIRPGVVWFGEAIPEDAMDAAFAEAAACDLFLSVGTSSEVYPAAGLVDIARGAGAVTAEVNTESTGSASIFDHVLEGRSGVILPKLVDSLSV